MPLKAFVCDECKLVQIEAFGKPNEIFDDYVYFSSYSDSWLKHVERYTQAITNRLKLNSSSLVVEIASNDGYLLQYFKRAGIPVLGIEPAHTVADAAIAKGIPTRQEFFDTATARRLADEGLSADLLLGNNVLAHVPDLNDFVAGMAIVLKPHGSITMEFPHLMRLVENVQFDTIYHEHYCYLSLTALRPIFQRAGLRVFDVETLPTHGGSLRLYVSHIGAGHAANGRVEITLAAEAQAGLAGPDRYAEFAAGVVRTRSELLAFLIDARRSGKRVAAYGAAAKGNTLLNYCGVRTDMVDFVADKNPTKQGRFLPGSRIPVLGPEAIDAARPDFVLILPWNIKDEIVGQLAHIRAWGGQFVVPIPRLEIIP